MTGESLVQRVTAKFGLTARPTSPAALEEALASMSRDHGLREDLLAQQVAEDGNLARELAGYLTVGESHFLRHPEQYDLVLNQVAERLAGSDSRIEVWSAGCSRGEEPLTLAILARSRFGQAGIERLRIVGSDICRAALDKARRGLYHPWSLRNAPLWFVDSNFTATTQGYYAARSSLLRAVQFEHIAVQERLAYMAPTSVDVLFFRNVAIYLAPEATTDIYEGFYRVLKDGGLLLTAPADPSPPRALFAREQSGSAGVFRRRGNQTASLVECATWQPCRARVLPAVRSRGAWRPRTTRGPRTTLLANAITRPAIRHGARAETRRSFSARELDAVGGEDRDVQRDQLMASGRSHLEALRLAEAIADFRRVLFLNQRDCIGRFWYAATLQRAGQLSKARGQVVELSRQLCELTGDTHLEDGDTTAAALLNAVHLMETSL